MTNRCLRATLAGFCVISVWFAIAPYQVYASGDGGTPGDWNYTNNMIGEHAIIHNGKLYAPLYDPDHGVNGGLAILNPITGSVIRHFTIPGYCTAAAPAFDKNGYLHIYDCGGFIKKLDENTGTVLRTRTTALRVSSSSSASRAVCTCTT